MRNFRLEDIEKAKLQFGFDIRQLSESESLNFHSKIYSKYFPSGGEIFPWDFYFTNKDLEYLVTHNDSDYLIASGTAMDWLKTKVEKRLKEFILNK